MSKKIILKSSDGELFEVDEEVAVQSVTIKHMIQDDCIDNGIPLPNVKSAVLAKVIEYCKKQVEDKDIYCPTVDTDLKNWEAEFVDVDQPMLFDLILAADYLNISGLVHLTCKTVADMMKGKTADQMRAIFNIKNDYTEKEEKEVREENDLDLK